MKQHIKLPETGTIQCDNENCDFVETVEMKQEVYQEYLDKPCPKCGANLLTEDDLKRLVLVFSTAQFINTLTEDELKEFNELAASTGNGDFIKNLQGYNDLDHNKEVVLTVKTHDKIEIIGIKNVTQ